MGMRLAAWWRWVVRPWRSAGLILALIASFALPAFMAASADVFLVSASDSITRQVIDENPAGLDISIVASGQLTPEGVNGLDMAVRSELDRVGQLSDPRRIVYADLSLQRPSPDGQAPPAAIIGSAARFIASDGAIDALEVIEGDRSVEGVWISESVSQRLGLSAGTLISVNGSAPLPLAGVFANLWEGERDAYWDALPAAFIPRFSTVFAGPLNETMVVPESVLLSLGTEGLVRWDTEMTNRPGSYAALSAQAARTRAIERSATESAELADALGGFSGPGGPQPTLTTGVFDLRDEVSEIVAELDQPIATASIGGIVLGLLVTAAGALFAVRRRETEVRLLRADGDAAWRFAGRAIAQFVAPATVGAVIGVAAAWLLLATPGGGTRPDLDAIDARSIVWVAVVGLSVAALTTGFAASQVLHTRRSMIGSLRLAWFLPVLGVAAAAWVQVGAEGSSAEVDLLVVSFPLVGLVAGVGLVVLAAQWLMHRAHRRGSSLPPALFLAWRRITSADASAVLLSAALGVALGLIMFSSSLVAGLDTASAAKATTAVGGVTQVRVDSLDDTELPDDTTVVLALSTRSTIGRDPVTVLAVDPATYAAGVSWHPAFGSSASEVIAALDQPVQADVAAVVAGQIPVSPEAGFGTSNVVTYAVVDTVGAAPLTSAVTPTLLVSADQVEAAAQRKHDAARPTDMATDEWADQFQSPLLRARPVLISQLDQTSLTDVLDDNGVQVQEIATLAERRDLVANRAARWTFEYVSLLAVIAGLAALGTLFFYLSEQRANRQLSTVMAQRMGLRRRTAAVAAVGEVLGLVVVAFLAGTSVGLVVATRLFNRFEPDPRLAPDVGLDAPWALVGTIAAGATVVVVLAALGNQWLAGRRTYAEVLRGS